MLITPNSKFRNFVNASFVATARYEQTYVPVSFKNHAFLDKPQIRIIRVVLLSAPNSKKFARITIIRILVNCLTRSRII